MPILSGINLFAAFFLFLLSSAMLYVTWYVMHGRKRKNGNLSGENKNEQTDVPQTKKKSKNKKWGYSKEDYCYPGINDVMGFEFVKVIKLKDEPQITNDNPEKTVQKPDWEQSRGLGSLSTESINATRQDIEEDSPFPENDTPGKDNSTSSFQNKFKQAPETESENNKIEESEITEADFSTVEYEAAMAWEGWENHEDDSFQDDEYINKMLDENPEMIEESEPDKESKKIIEDYEAYKQTLYEQPNDFSEEVEKLTEGLSFPKKEDTEDEPEITPDEETPETEEIDFDEDEIQIEEEI